VLDEDTPVQALSATINWGDGASSAGVLTGHDGEYTVTGRHVYRQPGQFQVTVTVSDPGEITVASGTATVTVDGPAVPATTWHNQPSP
jgi:hypothetical protein